MPPRQNRKRTLSALDARGEESDFEEEEPEGDDLEEYRDLDYGAEGSEDDGSSLGSFVVDDDDVRTASNASDDGGDAAADIAMLLQQKRRAAGLIPDDDEPGSDPSDMGDDFTDPGSDEEHDEDEEDENPYAEQQQQYDVDFGFDWTKCQGEIADWLHQDAPRRAVKNRLYYFFTSFTIANRKVYIDKIQAMAQENLESFEVVYLHLAKVFNGVLANWLAEEPDVMIELMDEVAQHLVYRDMFPNYGSVHRKIRVRITGLPVCDPIRDFRQMHMNVLVRVEGVVTRRSPVYPQLQAVRYDCVRCSYVIGPVMQRGEKEVKVSQCPSCHSKGPFRVNMALTEYRNHQIIVLQEPPGKVPPGRLPRSLEVVLTHDIIDRAKPGEEVDVTGVYRNTFDPTLNSRHGFPVFTTVLHANNVTRKSNEGSRLRLPEAEKEKILNLARHPDIKRKLLRSVAPSIHGRQDIKLALLLSLMSGVPKDVAGDQSHKIRGDINVLLLGDPGTAKSQFLKFVEKTADRAVFTTGRGSTAVGLTASVHKDPVTGDFTLEGGALVVADRGVCLIDEFDKMSDQDRTSIHEAMEQQTISVARGGIVTTLSARSSIIAAANPIGGRYDPSVSFDANVDLTTPILSRFDLLFVVRDEVNAENDANLARFVCRSHQRSHPISQAEAAQQVQAVNVAIAQLKAAVEAEEDPARRTEYEAQLQALLSEKASSNEVREDDDPASDKPLTQSLFKSYIQYAKAMCRPLVSNIDENVIVSLYAELRQQSKQGGLPITVRHMESIIRLSEAHAKLHLREFVKDEDVAAATSLFLKSFLGAQKYSVRQTMEQKFSKYLDSDVEPLQLLHQKLKGLIATARNFELQLSGGVEPTTVEIDCADLEAAVGNLNISHDAIDRYYTSPLFAKDFILHKENQVPSRIQHTRAF